MSSELGSGQMPNFALTALVKVQKYIMHIDKNQFELHHKNQIFEPFI